MAKKKQKPVALALLIFAALVPVLWMNRAYHQFLWDVSWYTVTILMLIRPLGTLLPKKLKIMRFLPYRKELGILSASVVVTSALYRFVPMGFGGFISYYFGEYWKSDFPGFMGHLAELVAFPLLITSNKFSQKLLKKWWKRIQRTTYLYYYGAGVLLVSFGKTDALVSMIIVGTLGTLTALKNRKLFPFNR